jgi:hypothetical protein
MIRDTVVRTNGSDVTIQTPRTINAVLAALIAQPDIKIIELNTPFSATINATSEYRREQGGLFYGWRGIKHV